VHAAQFVVASQARRRGFGNIVPNVPETINMFANDRFETMWEKE
jgi:hypothetical protein